MQKLREEKSESRKRKPRESQMWSQETERLDFPGEAGVKTSPSSAGEANSNRGQEAKIPHALQPKSQNIKQVILQQIQWRL